MLRVVTLSQHFYVNVIIGCCQVGIYVTGMAWWHLATCWKTVATNNVAHNIYVLLRPIVSTHYDSFTSFRAPWWQDPCISSNLAP